MVMWGNLIVAFLGWFKKIYILFCFPFDFSQG